MISDENFNNFDFYLNGIVEEKKYLKSISGKIEEFRHSLKDIIWEDLELSKTHQNGDTRYFKLNLPKLYQNKLKEIDAFRDNVPLLEGVFNELLYKEYTNNSFVCPIEIRYSFNRIHNSGNGMTNGFRNLGLGIKIYRKVVEEVGFISSEDDDELSSFGKLMWNSMRNSNLFFTFFFKTKSFAFPSIVDPNFVIDTISNHIGSLNFNEILWDEDFLRENIELIKESPLKKYLNN